VVGSAVITGALHVVSNWSMRLLVTSGEEEVIDTQLPNAKPRGRESLRVSAGQVTRR